MKIIPISLKEANEFVKRYHRHNKPVVTHKVSIGLEQNGELVGVGIAGRPISRILDDGRTLELRRVCVKDGFQNACSKLMARLKRIGQLLGYTRIITYTLQKESGASLRAIGGRPVARKPSSSWALRPGSGEHQAVYDEPKYRWELLERSENDKNESRKQSPEKKKKISREP